MFKRAVIAAGVVALAIAGPTLAEAKPTAKSKKHTYSITADAEFAAVSQTGAPPLSGSSLDAGILDGKIGAKAVHGAVRAQNTYGVPSPGHATSDDTTFTPDGSVHATSTLVGTLNPDGSISFSGSGKITGGTGVYKGAKGTLTFSGTQPKGSNVVSQHFTGKITY